MAAGTSFFYFLFAGVLVLLAFVCLFRGLAADAARGRRRCPKCWYDMSGGEGLVCSECGHDAGEEGRLERTRRHWGWTCGGILLVVLASVGGLLPVLSWSEMAKRLPTTALVLMMPDLSTTSPDAYQALCERASDDELWGWQWKLLAIRFRNPRQAPWEWSVEVTDHWPTDEALFGNAEFTVWSADPLWMEHSRLRARVTPLFGDDTAPLIFRPNDPSGLQAALQTFRSVPPAILTSCRLGVTSSSGGALSFRVEVQRHFPHPERRDYFDSLHDERRWKTIDRRETTISLDVSGTIDKRLTLHDDDAVIRAIRASLRFEVSNDRLQVREMFLPPLPEGLSAPIELELRRDGEAVASWLSWPYRSPKSTRHQFIIPGSVQGERRPFGQDEDDGHAWAVHVRGTPSKALLDDDATAAWSGEFEVPLYLHQTPELLQYRSWED